MTCHDHAEVTILVCLLIGGVCASRSRTGMALGVALLQLPWRIVGVMLAGSRDYYQGQAASLAAAFQRQHGMAAALEPAALPLDWVERLRPRRFGNVLPSEVDACRAVARAHGILLDPIYSLAAWEAAAELAARPEAAGGGGQVAMLHAGGGLALHGLAQRFADQF